jgi:dGTPase
MIPRIKGTAPGQARALSGALSMPNESALAPYALRESESRGRRRPEPPHEFRSDFQRDRDRITYSRPFRRLESKTQVFLNGTGDHLRTRLTHTIEVVAIARTLARGLGLNEDVTEAVALAHDLGHTPFGHAGERMLDLILRDKGGFDHNLQSLRIVDELESKYPSGPVLLDPQPDPEAQAADVADDLAYYTHDLDDGLRAGLLDEEMLSEVDLWNVARNQALAEGAVPGADYFHGFVVRCLTDHLVGDVIRASRQRIREHAPKSAAAVRVLPERLVTVSAGCAEQGRTLREFLFANVYWHPTVLAVNDRTANTIRGLFEFLRLHPEELPPSPLARVETDGLDRTVGDYIAGMTDRYALEMWERVRNR